MHSYSTDSSERRGFPLLVAILAVLASLCTHGLLLAFRLSPPWWFDMPSLLTFYGIFYGLFDRYVWRLRFLRRLGLVKTPDIAGIWHGHLTSSFDDHRVRHDATLSVSQTWTTIRILLETESSRSHSLSCSIITEDPDSVLISYEFRNEPKPHAKQTMHSFRGTARHWLRTEAESEVFDGEYYTGRDRETYGSLYFTRRLPYETP